MLPPVLLFFGAVAAYYIGRYEFWNDKLAFLLRL